MTTTENQLMLHELRRLRQENAELSQQLAALQGERDLLQKSLDEIAANVVEDGPKTLERLMALASLGKHTTLLGKARYAQLVEAEQQLAEAQQALAQREAELAEVKRVLSSVPCMNFLRKHRNAMFQIPGAADGSISAECRELFAADYRTLDALIKELENA